MAKDKKNQTSKAPQAPPPPPSTATKEPTEDDVALLEMEVEEVLHFVPPPVPATEETTLSKLLERAHGALVVLKDAEKRAKEQISQAEEARKKAEALQQESVARQKQSDKTIADYQGYLNKLSEVAQQGGIPFEPGPEGPMRAMAELHKEAHQALKTFAAAQKKAENATASAQAKEKDLERRKSELDAREKSLATKGNDLDKREKDLLDREVKIAQREVNAESDFLVQRKAILGAIEMQVSAFRTERDSLVKELSDKREADLTEWKKRGEEREGKWQAEDAARAKENEALRDVLTRELASTRERGLAEVRSELDAIRKSEKEKRETEWTNHARELDEREKSLVEKQRELRKLQADVQARSEILAEDLEASEKRAALFAAAKIAELEEELKALSARLGVAAQARDRYFQALEAHEELERQFGGRSPREILDRIDTLERDRAELRAKLQEALGEDAAQRLALLERERSKWLEEQEVLQIKLVDAEQRLREQRTAAVGREGLTRTNEALETTNKLLERALTTQSALLDAKIKELRAEVDQYTQADDQRNPLKALVEIDTMPDCQTAPRTQSPIDRSTPTLASFVDDLQHRVALAEEGKTLYYSQREIRCFLGGLAMSRLMLLQGISGTGKTSLPLAFAKAVGAGSAVVEVQAGWRDRQDLVGYYNAFHKRYYTTNFLQALYRAGTPGFRDRLFVMVLDEINLSRVEQFFADFLSALELTEDRRRITLLSDKVTDAPPSLLADGCHLPVPPNVWFVGTANHDETTTEFADKTYDRAHVMELPRSPDAFSPARRDARDPISYKALSTLFADAQNRKRDEVRGALDWLRHGSLAKLLDARFRVGWGNRFERDAERFIPIVAEANGTVGEALDHLLHTKVLRKLRDRHDVRAKALEEVRGELDKQWLSSFVGKPERCLDLLDREIRAKQGEEEG